MKQAYSAIRFLFTDVLQRELPKSLRFTFRKEERLPSVLSTSDIQNYYQPQKTSNNPETDLCRRHCDTALQPICLNRVQISDIFRNY